MKCSIRSTASVIGLVALTLVAACSDGVAPDAYVPDPVSVTIEGVCGDGDERADDFFFESHCKGVEPAYEYLFDTTSVRRLDVTIDREWYTATMADLEALLGGGGGPGGGPGGGDLDEEPMWAPVTVEYDGRIFRSVGMRYKGNSSLRTAWRSGVLKLPFRLTFDKYEEEDPLTDDQRFFGFKKMTFSSAAMDATLIRDKIAADLFRDAGIASARGNFVEVYLDEGNGPVYMGLYTMIEDPSNKMLEAQFGDDTGNLYKPEGEGAQLGVFDPDAFEKKNNEEDPDTSDVENFIAALNDDTTDAATWRANLEATFDVDHFLMMLAVSQTMVNWDAYGFMDHNYYLYADPGRDGRLVWIPWDLNESFLSGRRPGADDVMLSSVGSDWPLIRRVLDDAEYHERYLDALADVIDGPFHADDMHAKIEAERARVHPFAIAETSPYSNLRSAAEFDQGYDAANGGLHAHVDARHAAVSSVLNAE